MNTKLAAIIFTAGALLLPAAGQAADSESERASVKQFVKHTVITTKIKKELAEEKASSLAKIRVSTDQYGAVTLTGRANDQAAASKAVTIAMAVDGVSSVDSHIRVKADK